MRRSCARNSAMPAVPRAKWLEPISWADVTTLNARLCDAKGALHKPTSDGHDAARELWERSRPLDLSLEESIVICHRCHRLAPFCLFNGNTFVAGTEGLEELRAALREALD